MTISQAWAQNSEPRLKAGDMRVEASRRWVVRLIMAVLWMTILEGVLRKWAFPDQHRLILFLRDPLLILAFAIGFQAGFLRLNNPMVIIFTLGTMVVPFLLAAQALFSPYEQSIILSVYGWRNYLLYLPLIPLIAQAYMPADLDRLGRHVLWFAIFTAPLMVLQSQLDAGHPLNIGTGQEEGEVFQNLGLALGIVRATGPFTSSNGAYIFSVTTFAIALGFLLRGRQRREIGMPLLMCGLAASLICVALSGNRGSIVHAGIVVAFAYLAGAILLSRQRFFKTAVMPLIIALAAAALISIAFPSVFEALTERFILAQADEEEIYAYGIVGRAFRIFISFSLALDDIPLFGWGLGYGTNAAVLLELLPLDMQPEDDWHRHIVDLGPLLGIICIALRILFTGWLLRMCIRAVGHGGDATPLVLFGLSGIVLLAGQVTGHSTINAFACLFGGVCWAHARHALLGSRRQ